MDEGDDWKMDDRCGVKIRSHRVGSDRIFRSADKIRSLIIHSTDRRGNATHLLCISTTSRQLYFLQLLDPLGSRNGRFTSISPKLGSLRHHHPPPSPIIPPRGGRSLFKKRTICPSPFSPSSSSNLSKLANHSPFLQLTAPSRHMRRPLPTRLPHELHLPPLDALQPVNADYNHDHKPVLQKNHQLDQQPPRFDPRSRLGIPPAADPRSGSSP